MSVKDRKTVSRTVFVLSLGFSVSITVFWLFDSTLFYLRPLLAVGIFCMLFGMIIFPRDEEEPTPILAPERRLECSMRDIRHRQLRELKFNQDIQKGVIRFGRSRK